MGIVAASRRKVAGFTGRKWAFERIDQWLSSSSPAVLTITGLQGSGKSALATRLEQINHGDVRPFGGHLSKGFLTYAHFCQGNTDQVTSVLPHRFIEKLSGALIERSETARDYLNGNLRGNQQITLNPSLIVSGTVGNTATVKNLEVNIQIGDTSPLVHFDQLVRKPLEKVREVQQNLSIVVLIDALDEALDLDSDTTILDLLRGIKSLPPQVRWLITYRSDSRIQAVLGPPIIELTGKDNNDDLYNFAYEALDGFEEDLRVSRAKDIAEKGNFLYARSLLEDEKIVASLANTNSEVGLPDGLPDLYRPSKNATSAIAALWEVDAPCLPTMCEVDNWCLEDPIPTGLLACR